MNKVLIFIIISFSISKDLILVGDSRVREMANVLLEVENRAYYENTVEVTWKELGLNYTNASLRDLWARKDLEQATNGYKVKLKSHESQFLKVSNNDKPGPEPGPGPEPEPTDDTEDDDDENNTLIFTLTIGSLVLIIGFIFFVICFIKKKREKVEKAPQNETEDDPENLSGKLVRNTTDSQN